MNKILSRLSSLLLLLSLGLVLIYTGCNQFSDMDIMEDSRALPRDSQNDEVRQLKAHLAADTSSKSILLSWYGPYVQNNLYAFEIGWTPQTYARGMSPMTPGTLNVFPPNPYTGNEAVTCLVAGLDYDTEYTFTVKPVYKDGHKGSGASVTKTLVENPVSIHSLKAVKGHVTGSATTTSGGRIEFSGRYARGIKDIAWFNGGSEGNYINIDYDHPASNEGSRNFYMDISTEDTYTLYFKDTNGWEGLNFITLDLSPPAPAGNFFGTYSSVEQALKVHWQDPLDSDFKEVVLTWQKADGDAHQEILPKGTQSWTKDSVAPDEKNYTIKLKTRDEGGNESPEQSFVLKATSSPYVSGVSFDKGHFDNVMTNREITATIHGCNLTGARVKIKMESGPDTSLKDVSIQSAAAGRVSFNVPVEKGTYNILAFVNGAPVENLEASFRVTDPADITGISLEESQWEANVSGQKAVVNLAGSNLDIRGNTFVKVFKGSIEASSTPAITDGSNKLKAEIPVPIEEADYRVQCYIDGVAKGPASYLQVYGIPAITDIVSWPAKVGTEGTPVDIVIRGENLNIKGKEPVILVMPGNFEAHIMNATTAVAHVQYIENTQMSVTLNGIPVLGLSELFTFQSTVDKAAMRFIAGTTVTAEPPNEWSSGPFYSSQLPVKVGNFEMGGCEVTYALWKEVYDWAVDSVRGSRQYTFANPGREGHNGSNGAAASTDGSQFEPVTYVSWDDVVVWCNAYSEKEGLEPVYYTDNTYTVPCRSSSVNVSASHEVKEDSRGYRLPTEAEWEYAARGGDPRDSTNWSYTYAGSNNAGDVAWYDSNSGGASHPVGDKAPNGAGLYDMSGNVWEWCYSTSGSYRVRRGGSWHFSSHGLEVGDRYVDSPSLRLDYLGFRLCRTAD